MKAINIENAKVLADASLQEVKSHIENPRIADLLEHINKEVASIFEDSDNMSEDAKTILLLLIERTAAVTNMLQFGLLQSGDIVEGLTLPQMVKELVGDAIVKHKECVHKLFQESSAELNG